MKIFAALLQFTLAQHLRWFTKWPEPAQMDSFDVPAVSSYFLDSFKPKCGWFIPRLDFLLIRICALLEPISPDISSWTKQHFRVEKFRHFCRGMFKPSTFRVKLTISGKCLWIIYRLYSFYKSSYVVSLSNLNCISCYGNPKCKLDPK